MPSRDVLSYEPRRDLHPRTKSKLVPYLLGVVLRRTLGDGKPPCNLAVGQACGDQCRNLLFAPAQPDRCHMPQLGSQDSLGGRLWTHFYAGPQQKFIGLPFDRFLSAEIAHRSIKTRGISEFIGAI
jgi:hypothetical protein